MSSPKISIIIPVYNVEKYLESCLESVVNQSYKNIEIICVNDCSTDSSLDILNCYAARDNRLSIIDKKQNGGLLSARKSGVDAASGEYLLFLDSDDYIKTDLCQFITDNVAKSKFDIIQFGIEVEDYSNNSANAQWLKNALQPENRQLNGEEIIKEAYIGRSYVTSLVGKVFKTELCKKVYSFIPDEHCYVGEDIFTYFIYSCFAQRYIGIKTEGYYVYRYGLGVENAQTMSLTKFEQYCKMANWVKYAQQFLLQNGTSTTKETCCAKMQQRMFEDCCKIYKDRIAKADKDKAAELLVEYWQQNKITEKVMQDKLGVSMEKFIYQTKVPVFVKTAAAYSAEVKPLVSVIVPVYNVEKYLKECLNSLTNQTLKQIEIVCVNDGSPDNSLGIIEDYAQKDNRITVVSRKNGGLSAARNSGIENAKGKYIYFLDSDDFITENALEKLYTLSEKENLDILYFGVENYFENEELKKHDIKEDTYYVRKQYFDIAVSGDVLFERFLAEDMFICCVPFQFIRKDFLVESGITFKEGMLHEDELFSPQLILEAERTMVIEDKLYMRRIREDSIMTTAPTHRNFIGYFIAYTALTSKAIINNKYSDTAKATLSLYTRKLYNTSRRIYKQISAEEKRLVDINLPAECKLLFQPIKEQEATLNSLPYKVGMKATFIPRKVNATLKSYKEKGLKGTFQLIRKYYFK